MSINREPSLNENIPENIPENNIWIYSSGVYTGVYTLTTTGNWDVDTSIRDGILARIVEGP